MNDVSLRDAYREVFGALPMLENQSRFPERAGPFGDPAEKSAWQRMKAGDQRVIDEAFANVGKARAAYERLLKPGASRFDHYVAGLRNGTSPEPRETLTEEELRHLWVGRFPDKTMIDPDQLQDLVDHVNDVMREVAAEMNVALVDLPALLKGEEKIFHDGVHFSEHGSRTAAQLIATTLLEKVYQQ